MLSNKFCHVFLWILLKSDHAKGVHVCQIVIFFFCLCLNDVHCVAALWHTQCNVTQNAHVQNRNKTKIVTVVECNCPEIENIRSFDFVSFFCTLVFLIRQLY